MPCQDCFDSDIVLNGEGHEVCRACGLVQTGRGTTAPPSLFDAAPQPARRRPDAPAPPPPKLRRRTQICSRDRWIQRLRCMADRAALTRGITDTAVAVYTEASRMPDWKHRKHDYQVGVIVSCLFHACNAHGCHRTPTEICAMLDVDPRKARKMVKVTERAARIVVSARHLNGNACIDVPREVLPRYACRIKSLTDKQMGKIWKLSSSLYDSVRQHVDNHRPDTITAGLLCAVLNASGIEASNSDIADACMVAANTVKAISSRIAQVHRAAGNGSHLALAL